ncbi:MAG: hypothetical protein QF570_10140 [Myxococcota bacterium]|jgi:hypothetical protein|nr:hypothetical protein [Myxococcota bacterium]
MAGKLAQAKAAAAKAAAPKPLSEQLLEMSLVVAQLAVVIAAATRYRFESPAFQKSLPWIGVAVVAHHFLPQRYRMPFFTTISMVSVVYVLGIGPAGFDIASALKQAAPLIGMGLFLIALCHLPIAYGVRVALLFATGGFFMYARGGTVFDGALASVWPLLAAFFMFRLVIYAYDIQHEKKRPPIAQTLAYFFMLPNAFFPFFPVVDWKNFGRGYYNDDALRIYQRGLQWMARGVMHLVFYRIVYYHFYIDTAQVADGASLLKYIVANYAMYLRVSGQFHMIVGLLLLFGFNLPATNNHYFLAESFTDYWRRVNIYWKDFMVKIFYTPVAFRLRGRGAILPVVLGSAAAFVATWFLHAYQSYWLRGGMHFSAQDSIFWTILGVLVMVNAAWEVRKGRRRSLSKKVDWRDTVSSTLGTMVVFATMSLLWSLWSSPGVSEWLAMWQHVDATFFGYAVLTLLIVGAVKVTVTVTAPWRGGLIYGNTPKGANIRQLATVAVITVFIPMTLIYVLGDQRVHRRVDAKTKFILKSLKSNQPNTSNLRSMERGYYENLFDASSSNFLDSGIQAPPDWVDFPDMPLVELTGDGRYWTLTASRSEVINGYDFSTNAFGMRDKEYTLEKPDDVYRVAMLGSSHLMGWGVNDGETFGAIIEERHANERPDGKRIEMLNFGVGGYSPVCQLAVLREKALEMKPDAIYYIAHAVDGALAIERFARLVQHQIPLEDPFLNDIVERAGLTTSMSQLAMQRELLPFAEELVLGSYKKIVELASDAGALPVWIYMPRVPERDLHREPIEKLIAAAKEAGFITFDLSGLFGDTEVDDMVMSQWDMHPNAPGHAMMADATIEAMRSDPRLGFSKESEAR